MADFLRKNWLWILLPLLLLGALALWFWRRASDPVGDHLYPMY